MIRLAWIALSVLVPSIAAASPGDSPADPPAGAPYDVPAPPADPPADPPVGPDASPAEASGSPGQSVPLGQPLEALGPVSLGRNFEREAVPIALHLNVGIEANGAPNVASAILRTHVGISWALGRGRVRPMIGGGATFGYGALSVGDPRALDGTVAIGYLDYGPEAQIGLRFVDGGAVDMRVFASFAYLSTDLDDRLMLDAVGGVGGTRGMRAMLGLNWADRQAQAAAPDHTGKGGDADWLIMLLPQQVELGWIRSAGSDRVGITLSYGI